MENSGKNFKVLNFRSFNIKQKIYSCGGNETTYLRGGTGMWCDFRSKFKFRFIMQVGSNLVINLNDVTQGGLSHFCDAMDEVASLT